MKSKIINNYVENNSLSEVKQIKIAEGLTEFPIELFEWSDTLEILDLSNNKLSSLPADFGKFKKLKIVFFANNEFREFPKVLADCPELSMVGFKSNKIECIPENAFPKKLRWLILTDNQIACLPNSIGNCEQLQKCALAGNQLTHLPSEMANCRNLELLRISANQLQELPQWLIELPRLSWLAFSGNPCTSKVTNHTEIEFVSWEELELQEQLGEGASGFIYKAFWKTIQKSVAIKLFKGAVTSDGYPSDELATCLTTGNHPNLVPLLAQIQNHPENKQGFVMELITPEFTNLGNPPSFETCSRDVFAPDQKFEWLEALQLITSIASAAKHLHDKGILHGDLYAHNTLYRIDGYGYLGDFGAASFYDKNGSFSTGIERLDVGAFGCFMEDVLTRTNYSDENKFQKISSIMNSCLDEDHKKRPDFKGVLEVLQNL